MLFAGEKFAARRLAALPSAVFAKMKGGRALGS